ncbi:MAG: hypothetical protein KAT43_05780 [Nanoarchaeota archaeon]|nr:hypothetical protein [Nanoarchaeota archaeon]
MTSNDGLSEIFNLYYPEGRIEWIAISDIPEQAMKCFEGYSKRFILPKDYKPGDFTGLFVVRHNDDMRTYIARQPKLHDDGEIEELTYLFEMDENNASFGHGEIRFYPAMQRDYFKDKPFVGYSHTNDDYLKRGLAIRRLVLMNALSQLFFDLPLHSSERFVHVGAGKAWERLVKQGKAKSYQQDKRTPLEIRLKEKPEWCERFVFV